MQTSSTECSLLSSIHMWRHGVAGSAPRPTLTLILVHRRCHTASKVQVSRAVSAVTV